MKSAKMSLADEKYNMLFVKCVKEYPCLYDVSLKDYSRRDKIDEAWACIAKKMGDTESNCRERWKNIRTVFCRHVKEKKVGSKKSYYLYDALQFLIPYIKTKKPKPSTTKPELVSVDNILNESNDLTDVENESTIRLYKADSHEHCSYMDCDSNSKNEEMLSSNLMLSTNLDSRLSVFEAKGHRNINGFQNSGFGDRQGYFDPDKSFLAGLHPELLSLTATKKRHFKLKVLQILNHLLDEQSIQENGKNSSTPLFEPDTFTKTYDRIRPSLSDTDEMEEEYTFVSSLLDDSDLGLSALPNTPGNSSANFEEKNNCKRTLEETVFSEPVLLPKTKRSCDSSSSCFANLMDNIPGKKEAELELFGRSIALQLSHMSEAKALKLQLKIQTMITHDRLEDLENTQLFD